MNLLSAYTVAAIAAALFALALAVLTFVGSCMLYKAAHEERDMERLRRKIQRAQTILMCLFVAAMVSVLVISLKQRPHCPNCDAVVTTPYCEQCGEQIDATITCSSCGEKLDTPFCGNCGTAADLSN